MTSTTPSSGTSPLSPAVVTDRQVMQRDQSLLSGRRGALVLQRPRA